MSNDQAKARRHAYTSMKENLLKYEMQVRRKFMFPIATVLDPRFKLEHVPHGEHKFVMETLLNMLESVRIIEASSSMPIDDLFASMTHKHSKIVMQFRERQSSRSRTVDEKSIKIELEDYLCNLVLIAYAMTRYSSGTREDLTNIYAFQCSQRSFYVFLHQALPLSIFFHR